MGARRKAREAVLEALYCYEIRDDDQNLVEIFNYCAEGHKLEKSSSEFGLNLLKKIIEKSEELDKAIAKHTENWDFSRLAIIDKNILRLGLAEIYYFPDIPKKVAIDEAIELAKTYGSADSGRFVNGILDSLGRDL
ncbi:MAG: transcription antitermination factor NusB [Candidatus Zixiibacteriota bacterium]|nr:MAG: transcription antitermination factor NusB [candidate division Zixibacteria bacterium]